jgi:Na+-translocating ferredoxin:NAD+ oxidoreductase RnfC subunit
MIERMTGNPLNLKTVEPGEIIELVRQAGIVGAGGGGFPTHIKLDASVDTVIANGSECEPLLASDKTLLKENAALVIEGMKYVMAATGAKIGYVAVKGHYRDAVEAVEKELPGDGSIRVFRLENYYPAGDEFLTVYDVTGRVIPEGGLPLHVGVLVSNVLTLAQVARSIHGKPVTERPVTVCGSVNRPQVVTVPIGTPYRQLIRMAGGTVNSDDVLMDGGPMMGRMLEDWDSGVAKTTSGVVALPAEHLIVRLQGTTVSQMVKKSKAACCQCYRCTDLCPRNLVGHELYPHMTMRTIDYNLSEPTEHITSAFLCSQCGLCELVACDFMQLSPRRVYAEYKKLLIAKGIKNPHVRKGLEVLPELEYRKVSLPLVIKKLGLSEYLKETPSKGYQSVERVRVPLNRQAGVAAIPCVVPGDTVKIGEVIASAPPDKMGSILHASIEGKVTEVTDTQIEITKY